MRLRLSLSTSLHGFGPSPSARQVGVFVAGEKDGQLHAKGSAPLMVKTNEVRPEIRERERESERERETERERDRDRDRETERVAAIYEEKR